MQRALELAGNGAGFVSPNPMVGCVIVCDDEIIGEGWHMQHGGPHAEVNAINNVQSQSKLSRATAYVTLEPCSHYGITPPCSDLLIASKIKRVVICNVDPNPKVSGSGIEKMEAAGIQVKTGLLAEQGEELNKRFFTFHREHRPYIILKWAETADGFIARKNFDSKWISNECSRQLVHRWRAEEDAILVGKNTANYDDPTLTVRDSVGKNPTRILLDHHLKVKSEIQLFDHKVPTLCYNYQLNKSTDNLEFISIEENEVEKGILHDLYSRNILSVLIEGGTATLQSFIDSGWWDEARIFKSESVFKEGIKAPHLTNGVLKNSENIVGDQLLIYTRIHG